MYSVGVSVSGKADFPFKALKHAKKKKKQGLQGRRFLLNELTTEMCLR